MNCGGPDSGACDPRGRGLPHACANERGSPRGPTTRVCIACAVPSFFILRCSSSCAIADQNGFMIHLRFGFFWAVSLSDDALLKVTGNIRRQKATPVSPKFEGNASVNVSLSSLNTISLVYRVPFCFTQDDELRS